MEPEAQKEIFQQMDEKLRKFARTKHEENKRLRAKQEAYNSKLRDAEKIQRETFDKLKSYAKKYTDKDAECRDIYKERQQNKAYIEKMQRDQEQYKEQMDLLQIRLSQKNSTSREPENADPEDRALDRGRSDRAPRDGARGRSEYRSSSPVLSAVRNRGGMVEFPLGNHTSVLNRNFSQNSRETTQSHLGERDNIPNHLSGHSQTNFLLFQIIQSAIQTVQPGMIITSLVTH